jgi:hypothetical protein
MKKLYTTHWKNITLCLVLAAAASGSALAQACSTAQGDQTTYGTNNVWIGYVYTGMTLSTGNYQGYDNEGTASSPNFDEGFGGGGVTYNTNGCSITTDNFSVRYKLTESFVGNFTITVGGDDGYRLSLDGGSTWAINKWVDQSYNTTSITVNLTGSTNFVLEYYQDGGANEVSFNITQNCVGTSDTTVYGANGIWDGYVFEGMNLQGLYKGMIHEGSTNNPTFDENFGNAGGSNSATFNTNSCQVTTYQFSARYRLQQTLAAENWIITVGGDDGYRLSLDGGNTFVIDNWQDQSYTVSSYSAALSGNYNMVLDYYQNGGDDRVTYSQSFATLPISLIKWSVTAEDQNQALLKWTTTDAVNFDHFVVQRSTDGSSFMDVQTVAANPGDSLTQQNYSYTDQDNWNGTLYYRLMMVDRDGQASYSNILSLSLQVAQSIRIYPTMVENGSVFIETSNAVNQALFELFDMNGHRLQTNTWSSLQGKQPVTIGANCRLPAGAYIVRLSNAQTTLAKQVIVIK